MKKKKKYLFAIHICYNATYFCFFHSFIQFFFGLLMINFNWLLKKAWSYFMHWKISMIFKINIEISIIMYHVMHSEASWLLHFFLLGFTVKDQCHLFEAIWHCYGYFTFHRHRIMDTHTHLSRISTRYIYNWYSCFLRHRSIISLFTVWFYSLSLCSCYNVP